MDFVALDIEIANSNMASICQIGMARFSNGEIVEEWESYVDPEDYFDPVNISLHGIAENTVRGAPKYKDIHDQICSFLTDRIVLTHTPFDRVSLAKVNNKYKTRLPESTWLDSARVVRRTWEEYARSGYGLYNVCKALNYDFNHHDALEDAKATGFILLAAMKRTGLDLKAWLRRVEKPIDLTSRRLIRFSPPIRRDGNPEGLLFGETIVFTGALQMPRQEAADMAAQVGCSVSASMTKQTTILVVGDQDISQLAGHKKSSKHRKAEELILAGLSIRILQESDFEELLNQADRITVDMASGNATREPSSAASPAAGNAL